MAVNKIWLFKCTVIALLLLIVIDTGELILCTVSFTIYIYYDTGNIKKNNRLGTCKGQ